MTLKNRSRSLIIKLVRGLYVVKIWYKFGGPAMNLWQVITSTAFCYVLAQVTLKIRSRSLIIELVLDFHVMHAWCKFGDPAMNLWQIIVNTASPEFRFCPSDLENRSRSLIIKLVLGLHEMHT